MRKFLFFGTDGAADGGDSTGEAVVYPLEGLKGTDATGAAETTFYFMPMKIGNDVLTTDLNDKVVVTHTGATSREFMKAFVQAAYSTGPQYSDGWLVVADGAADTGVTDGNVTVWNSAVTLAA